MHVSCTISYVVWKSKCFVFLLSIHSTPIFMLSASLSVIPSKHRANDDAIRMSLVFVEYITHMHNVDVADGLLFLIPMRPGATNGGIGYFRFLWTPQLSICM